jgi:hypothetical protein
MELYLVGSGVISRGQSGRGVELTTSSAEIKNECSCTSAPFMCCTCYTVILTSEYCKTLSGYSVYCILCEGGIQFLCII